MLLREKTAGVVSDRQRLIDVALGKTFADVMVNGGLIVDVYTGEIRRADIAIVGQRIAAVGDVGYCQGPDTHLLDATGMFVAPGLVDGHLHYHHMYVEPGEGAKLLLARGVTASADGFYGEGIVGGAAAVRAMKARVDSLPIRLIFLAPTQSYLQNRMFGLTPAPGVSVAELREMLDWPGCYGLDETPFSAVVDKNPDLLPLFDEVVARGLVLTGHVAGASEREVQAFAAMGGSMDHEGNTLEDTLIRARAGMKVLMRYGSSLPDLPNVIRAYTHGGISPRQLAICTDVLLPETLIEMGGQDAAVRVAIKAGVRPSDAIAMATLNVAEAFRADHDLGSLTPGRFADMIFLNELETLAIDRVFVGGVEVARQGKVNVAIEPPSYPAFMRSSVKVAREARADDFVVKADRQDGPVRVRVIGVSEQALATAEIQAVLTVKNGEINADLDQDVLFISIVDRLGKGAKTNTAFVKGFELRAGAIASTRSPVCENIAVVGADRQDMALAVQELARLGGGQVVVRDGKVLATFPMPILGLFSDRPIAEVTQARANIRAAAQELGCRLLDPLIKLEFCYAAAEFPLLRMSEEGLIRTHPRSRVGLICD